MWIGVLSDTYGKVEPKIIDIFEGVDFILHCGNIGGAGVLEALSHCAPVTGVLGSIDDAAEYDGDLTTSLSRSWFDTDIYIAHRIGDPLDLLPGPKQEIEAAEPEVILFGHSHEPFNTRIEGRHYLNPGSASRRKNGHAPSVALLELDGKTVRGEIVSLKPS